MKKCLLALIFIALISTTLFADGKAFRGMDMVSFRPLDEHFQNAIIAHKNGREAMLLAVNFSLEDNEKAFWLFPVPGRPEQVNVNILDTFPSIRGIDPRVEAENIFGEILAIQMLLQPYTWSYTFFLPALGTAGTKDIELNVYSIVDKYGLKAETLSTDSSSALALHLKKKGIQIDESQLSAFKDYFNERYTLVLVEISSKRKLLQKFPDYKEHFARRDGRWPAVFVEFPSEKIFFPLKPTGTYDDYMAISLKIFGHVKNEAELSKNWHLGYYRQTNTDEALPSFLASYIPQNPVYYTSYYFEGESKELTDDMWMTPFKPKAIGYANFLYKLTNFGNVYEFIGALILLILLQSWLCGGITGLIIFRKWHPYAIVGLGNIFTLVGVYLLTKYGKRLLKTDFYDQNEVKKSKLAPILSLFFAVATIIFYVVLTAVVFYLIAKPWFTKSWSIGVTGFIIVLILANILTFLVTYFSAKYSKRFLKTKFHRGKKKSQDVESDNNGKKESKRVYFLVLFSFIFMVSSVIFYMICTLPFYGI